VIEELQTAWEAKLNSLCMSIYHEAISDGLDKLKKCYSQFDKKRSYVLALGMSLLNSRV
jgi:hypothetical protein